MNWRMICLSVGLVFAMLAATGNAEMIDDFTDDVLNSNWVQSTVLTHSGGTQVPTFDTTTNDDQLTITCIATGKQEVLLRSDYSLDVGLILTTDFVSMSTPSGSMSDAGISIAMATGITAKSDGLLCRAVWTTSNEHKIQVDHWNGSSSSAVVTNLSDFSTVAGLYIERTGVNTYDAGYIDTSGVYQSVSTVTHTSGNNPGAAVGYYSDMRYPTGTAVFDNFQVIPEPSTIVLLGLGMLGTLALARVRRRN